MVLPNRMNFYVLARFALRTCKSAFRAANSADHAENKSAILDTEMKELNRDMC